MSEKLDQSMNDNNESSSDSSSSIGIPFKKPHLIQKWQRDAKMSGWLKKQEDGSAWCVACKMQFAINARKCVLLKHAGSIHHKMNMHKRIEEAGTSIEGASTINEGAGSSIGGVDSSIEDADSSTEGADSCIGGADSSIEDAHSSIEGAGISLDLTKDEIKAVAIRYCLFAIERNLSFETIQGLNELNKCIVGSKLPALKSIKLKQTKIRAIIKNVIDKFIVSDIKEIIREKYFSIIIDESTDISNVKNLCILIRFINNNALETHLLDLIGVKDATAKNIFNCIVYSLSKLNLSISNIVGVGVDNASVMIGCNNSLMTRFKSSNSEIVAFTCLCHSIHLVALHATKCIPDFINEMLQDIYKFFSQSPKREALLHDIQQLTQREQQKIFCPSKTRWLALAKCIEKILNQWVPLYTLFAEETLNDNLNENSIYTVFTNDFTKPYLEFLNYILQHFCKFNMLLQSNTILIHTIGEECKSFIRVLASHFIKQEFLEDGNFEELNAMDPNILLPLDNIFIGGETTMLMHNLRESKPEISSEITEFYKIIQKFYQIAYVESIKRLPYNDQFVDALKFLDPKLALNHNNDVHQIEILIQKFPSKVIGTKVINQWVLLASELSADEKEKLKALNVVAFWSTVSNLKDALGNLLYDEVAKLAFICLSLPHSNADVERYFSTITDIKSKKRNKLHTDMVCALTRIKLYLQSKHIDACSFQIPDEMLQYFNKEMYNREQIPSQLHGVLHAHESRDSSGDNNIC